MPWRDRMGAKEVMARVGTCVLNSWPASVIRLGDGEGPFMGWPEHRRLSAVARSMRYWFGKVDTTRADISAISAELRAAIRNADIVGVPTKQQQQQRLEWRYVEQYIREFDLMPLSATFTDANLHRQIMDDGSLLGLLEIVDNISVITCRDVVDGLRGWSGVKEVNWFRVPVEAQTNDFLPTDHWPKRFEELREELVVPTPGHLFLVGAGVLGKIYCSWIKERGGVALDIGSIFDVWAGVRSRSYQTKLGF